MGQPASGQSASALSDPAPAFDTIFARWNHPDHPGCTVAVARAGQAPLVHAYGSADLEHDVPNRADTVFEAGSVSKQIVAASILLLVQQGRLALTDDIRRHLPELPDYGSPITIDQLLSHTSGLRDWGEVEALAGWPRTSRVYTPADVLAIAARQKHLNYPPGTAYSYTNTGYNLLAIIIERISGQTLAEFSREHLFVPLGMTHTGWRDDFRRVVKGRAIAYLRREDRYEQDMPFENAYGNGGMLTTVGDLLRWNQALTQGELGATVTERLQQPATLKDGRPVSYARGLFIGSWHGIREIAHPGATAGYRAWLGRYPDEQLSIALLCNAADADTSALVHEVADLFLPARGTATANASSEAPRPSSQADKPFSAQPLAPLTGRYRSEEALATWQVEISAGQLIASPLDRPGLVVVLKPEATDRFVLQHPDLEARLRFDRDAKGRVMGFTMSSGRVDALKFERIASRP